MLGCSLGLVDGGELGFVLGAPLWLGGAEGTVLPLGVKEGVLVETVDGCPDNDGCPRGVPYGTSLGTSLGKSLGAPDGDLLCVGFKEG